MNGPGIQGTQRGVLLALATAAISGLSVYLNAFGVKLVSDAAVYTTAKNAVAALVLVTIALLLGARHEASSLAPRPRLGVLAIAVIGGSVPFVLFFSGLAVATAPTAAFIHKTMFIWVAFLCGRRAAPSGWACSRWVRWACSSRGRRSSPRRSVWAGVRARR